MAVQWNEQAREAPGLPGRDVFSSELDALLATASEQTACISVAVLDVDLFGEANAAHGREAMDDVISTLAAIFAAAFAGPECRHFRIGGDALGLLLVDVDKEQAFLRLEAFRQSVEQSGVSGLSVTVSAGLASFPDDSARGGDLANKAFEALYRAKVSGRNKVCLAREERMVTKTSHYTQGQLLGLRRLAEREGIGEAVLLREALNDLLRKRNA